MPASTEIGLPMQDGESPFQEPPLGRAHGSLSEKLAQEIKGAILAGHLQPGERLTEAELAERNGVSRNPVREALRLLAAWGFVEIVPRHGAKVAVLDHRSVQELFEVRSALEALMARLAAERITPDLLEELKAVVAEGKRAVEVRAYEALPQLNTRFHGLVATAAGNSRLLALNETVRDTIQWTYSRVVRLRGADSWEEHRGVYEAIARHDATAAAHLAIDHIARAEAAYLELTQAETSDQP